MVGPGRSRDDARRGILAACVAIVAVALSACGGASAPESTGSTEAEAPVQGGTVVVGTISDIDVWNEYLSSESFAYTVLRRVYEPLAREVTKTEGPRHEPVLARSWSLSEDGLALRVTLADRVWSDGTPVSAEDVRYTWQAQTAPEVAWSGAGAKSAIREVEVVDPETVVFRFERAYPEAIQDAFDGGIVPRHVFSRVPFSDWQKHDWSNDVVGSGPFLLAEHRPSESIRLTRNPRYAEGERPYVDAIVFRVVPDLGNLVLQLSAGEIDYLEGVAPVDHDRLRAAGAEIVGIDFLNYDYIAWNGDRPPFDDPDVRRAMTLAIDRRAIVDEVLYGSGKVAAGPVPSAAPGAPGTEPWPHDPELAVELLRSAGFRPDDDGILAREGERLEFSLTTNAGNEVRRFIVQKVQADLAAIGVAVEVGPALAIRTFRSRNVAGEYDAYVGGWRFTGKPELAPLFGSDAVPPNGLNVVRYRASELDAELAGLAAAATPDERDARYAAIHDIVHRDQPYTFLVEQRRFAATGPRLRGLRIEAPTDTLAGFDRVWLASSRTR